MLCGIPPPCLIVGGGGFDFEDGKRRRFEGKIVWRVSNVAVPKIVHPASFVVFDKNGREITRQEDLQHRRAWGC